MAHSFPALKHLAAVLFCAAVLTLAAAGLVSAHRLNEALTTIDVNPRTGGLEVIHEVFMHDLEEAFIRRHGRSLIVTSDKTDVGLAIALVTEAFRVAGADGQPVPLTLIGAERHLDRLIIYREAASPPPLAQMMIEDGILMDAFPAQTNRVHVRNGDRVYTLIFDATTVGETHPALPQRAED